MWDIKEGLYYDPYLLRNGQRAPNPVRVVYDSTVHAQIPCLIGGRRENRYFRHIRNTAIVSVPGNKTGARVFADLATLDTLYKYKQPVSARAVRVAAAKK